MQESLTDKLKSSELKFINRCRNLTNISLNSPLKTNPNGPLTWTGKRSTKNIPKILNYEIKQEQILAGTIASPRDNWK